jgi:hypothetical protein
MLISFGENGISIIIIFDMLMSSFFFCSGEPGLQSSLLLLQLG